MESVERWVVVRPAVVSVVSTQNGGEPPVLRSHWRVHEPPGSLLREQIHEIEQERLRQLSVVPDTEKGPLAMVRLLARIIGVGIETADMLVNEILSRGRRRHWWAQRSRM
ncbi:hypothetical protein NKI78_33195 [Mesorhizobium sp. M0400]